MIVPVPAKPVVRGRVVQGVQLPSGVYSASCTYMMTMKPDAGPLLCSWLCADKGYPNYGWNTRPNGTHDCSCCT